MCDVRVSAITQHQIIMIIVIIMCPGYDIKLHPVAEFRRGIMRLPFPTTTSRSPFSSPRDYEVPGWRPAGDSPSHG